MNYKKSKNKITFKPDIFPNHISSEQNNTSVIHINSFNNIQGSGNGNTFIKYQSKFSEMNYEKRIKELEDRLANFEYEIKQYK